MKFECWNVMCPNYAAAGVVLRESETCAVGGTRRCGSCAAVVSPLRIVGRSALLDAVIAGTAGSLLGACAAGGAGAAIGGLAGAALGAWGRR